jgi:rhodanese-related sulfurtransferase
MPSTSAFQTKVINLSPLEFTRLQNPPFLIDVRSQLEYARGHAPQAKNLSLPRILMGKIGGLKPLFLPQWFRDLSKE